MVGLQLLRVLSGLLPLGSQDESQEVDEWTPLFEGERPSEKPSKSNADPIDLCGSLQLKVYTYKMQYDNHSCNHNNATTHFLMKRYKFKMDQAKLHAVDDEDGSSDGSCDWRFGSPSAFQEWLESDRDAPPGSDNNNGNDNNDNHNKQENGNEFVMPGDENYCAIPVVHRSSLMQPASLVGSPVAAVPSVATACHNLCDKLVSEGAPASPNNCNLHRCIHTSAQSATDAASIDRQRSATSD